VGKRISSREERSKARLAFDNQCLSIVKTYNIDYIILAGFDQILSKTFVDSCPFRILNIHPAYDLKTYGGKNMVGSKVHASVLASGAKYSGCTVHLVTNNVDQGPAILKKKVPVRQGDTVETLEKRILTQEHLIYPKAVQLLVDGRVIVSNTGTQCFVDQFSDNWDINWWERQYAYVEQHYEPDID